MEFVIVTGMSGSGKSSCIQVLEDIGYFCIDNMPPALIPNFAEMCVAKDISRRENGEITRVAIVTDIRGGVMFFELSEIVENLKNTDGIEVRVLFLEASEEVLVNRYSETRRKHPLCEASGGDISKAIQAEQELLRDVRASADYIIDSSLLSVTQFKEQIAGLFLDKPTDRMLISCMSFGYKFGVPKEADMVFDVRCLPNPFYVPELKAKTGEDREVRDYVMSFPQSVEYERKIRDMVDFLLPQLVREGRSRLVIAFGCTGGKHRSATFALRTADYFREKGLRVSVIHRDINRKKG